MRGRAGIGAVLCWLALANGAAASGGARGYAVRIAHGTLTLAFHGDQATGCAQHGTCDTTGTITVTLPATGAVAQLLSGNGELFGFVVAFGKGEASATVRTTGAPDCTDSQTADLQQFSIIGGRRGRVALGYGNSAYGALTGSGGVNFGSSGGGADPFESRCAGPLASDYASALPHASFDRLLLLHRGFAVSLAGARSFSGGGFAGTLTTDLSLGFTRRACHGRRARRACRAFGRFVAKSA